MVLQADCRNRATGKARKFSRVHRPPRRFCTKLAGPERALRDFGAAWVSAVYSKREATHMDETARPDFEPEGLRPAAANLADIARKLAAALPGVLGGARRDAEAQLQAVLQAQLSKLDLCSRRDFEVQAKVLERTRERLQLLEARAAVLEARLKELEAGQAAR